MFKAKLQTVAAVLLGLGVIGVTTGVVAGRGTASGQSGEDPPAGKRADADAASSPAPVPAKATPGRFENAPGWVWYSTPEPTEQQGAGVSVSNILGRGYSAIFDEGKDGALLVYLAYQEGRPALNYRPVAFDAGRKRYPFDAAVGAGHLDVRLTRFRLDPRVLPAAEVRYLGFEYLTPAGRRVAAQNAAERALEAGVEVLPFPEMGKAYDFTLTTAEGKKLRARDLRGKVVLIDCWASWCTPCVQKMPALKAAYEKYRRDGLEVVGVCLDTDAGRAKEVIRSLKLPWPQVLVPAEEKGQELWEEATGVTALPRLLVLDREGVLRADCSPHDLEKQITALLGRGPSPPPPDRNP